MTERDGRGAKAHGIKQILRLADTAWDRTKRQLHNQEMGGARRAGRCGLLPCAVGGGGCDPALLHHGRDCAHRSDGRSSDTHLPHPHRRGVRRAVTRAGSHRSSELSDVVRGDIGARRGISAGVAVDEQRRRYATGGKDRAMGRPRDRRPAHRLGARRHGDDPLHRLSFPPNLPLWRDRQSDCDAGCVPGSCR